MVEREQKQKKKKDDRLIYLLYAAVLILIILYILQNSIIIGALAFGAIIVTMAVEFKSSITSEGVRKTAIDLVIAAIAVVIVVWILPSFLLQSSSPTNVVASCSMLPSLGRGDLVLVHGISNFSSFIRQNRIPTVNVSAQSFNSMLKNITSEYLEPFAYLNNDKSDVVLAPYLNSSLSSYSFGMYNLGCIQFYLNYGETSLFYKCYVASQANNLIRYNYTIGNVTVSGKETRILETSNITIANTMITEDYGNPVVVYQTVQGDSFATDPQVIHRVYAVINASGSYYVLTKGDNNPVLDIQAGNYPAGQAQVIGYLFASVPYLGYPSLIIKGQLAPVAQCNQTILNN